MERFALHQQGTAETDEQIRQSLDRLFDIQRQDGLWTLIRQRLLYTAEQNDRESQPTAGSQDDLPQ